MEKRDGGGGRMDEEGGRGEKGRKYGPRFDLRRRRRRRRMDSF